MSGTNQSDLQFAVCIRNDDYPASLEVRKVYRVIPDPEAEQREHVRVVDESGEAYLYPAEYFVPITLPDAAAEAFRAAG
jgi:hypothetical protein